MSEKNKGRILSFSVKGRYETSDLDSNLKNINAVQYFINIISGKMKSIPVGAQDLLLVSRRYPESQEQK